MKAKTECFGYFIRKIRWKYLSERYPTFFRHLDKNGYVTYIHKILKKIKIAKKKDISDLKRKRGAHN